MNILIYFNPVVTEMEPNIKRAFSAIFELQIAGLGRKLSRSVTPLLLAHEDMFSHPLMIDFLKREKFPIAMISAQEIRKIFAEFAISSHSDYTDLVEQKISHAMADLLKNKIKKYFQQPDAVIVWENLPSHIFAAFPKALCLEGHHTAFYRTENMPDIIYNVANIDFNLFNSLKKYFSDFHLDKEDMKGLSAYSQTFVDFTSLGIEQARQALNLNPRYKRFIFYPGHLETAEFKKFTWGKTNRDIVDDILRDLPDDCALLYSPHPVAQGLGHDCGINSHPQIVDCSSLKQDDPLVTNKLILLSDAMVNVHSNALLLALLVGKPVFGIGSSWHSDFCLGNELSLLKDWLTGKIFSQSQLELFQTDAKKLCHYFLTRKLPCGYFGVKLNFENYLTSILVNDLQKEERLNIIPQTRTSAMAAQHLRDCFQFHFYNTDGNIPRYYHRPSTLDAITGCIISKQYTNIGFDIFDTILCRTTFKPTDIFSLIEEDVEKTTHDTLFRFANARINAENIARTLSKDIGKQDPSFECIYKQFSLYTKFSQKETDAIYQCELDAEKHYVRQRVTGVELLRLAKRHGKQVILISDMYLSSIFIKSLLDTYGITEFDYVYISSEHGVCKRTGDLFLKVMSELNIDPQNFVFIGDNYAHDIKSSQKLGITAFHFPSASERLKGSKCFEYTSSQMEKYSNRHHLGIIANKLFDNPFVQFNPKTTVNLSYYALGYYIFGPLLLSYIIWCCDKIQNESFNRVLFYSRDGWMPKKIYDKVNESLYNKHLPKSSYFYISRITILQTLLHGDLFRSILDIYDLNDLTVKNFFNNILCINISEFDYISASNKYGINIDASLSKQKYKVMEMINNHRQVLEEIGTKNLLLDYYKQEVGEATRPVIIDIGSRGTLISPIAQLLQKSINVLFLRTTRYKKSPKVRIHGYKHTTVDLLCPSRATPFFSICELIASNATEGTCTGYYSNTDGHIVPKTESQVFSASMLKTLTAQKGVMDFVTEYIDTYAEQTLSFNYLTSRDSFFLPLQAVLVSPLEQRFINGLSFTDSFRKDTGALISGAALGVPVKASLLDYFGMLLLGSANSLKKFKRSPYEYWANSPHPILRPLKFFWYKHRPRR
jgi:FMN phosphatase YigB (HAD superfamily)